jgi:hypothetical protein
MLSNQIVSSTINSVETNVQQLDQASIDFRWSASSLVATLKVQVKNGKNANWRDVDFGSPINISGSSGSHEVIFLAMPFTDLRLRVEVTSGSGTLDAVITAKTVGA